MYKIWISAVMALLFTCGGVLHAKEYGGHHVITRIKTKDGEIRIPGVTSQGSVYVTWHAGTLMGEPVIDCKGVVILPEKSHYQVFFKNQSYAVPADVIKKIKAVSVVVAAHVSAQAFMALDLGAMGHVYLGSARHIPGLSEKEKSRYFSYNVSGSPDWGKLFRKSQGLEPGYLSRDQAKKVFASGMEIQNLFTYAEADFDLTPVKNWIDSQTKDKKIRNLKTEDPFKKFENMEPDGSDKQLKPIHLDIRNYILEKCGNYYTKVREGEQGFHLTVNEIGETAEQARKKKQEAKERERQREIRVRSAISDALTKLPGLQERWKEKRAAIKGECRTYIMKKYGLHHSVDVLENILHAKFTSTDGFEAVYYISHDGHSN